MQHLNNTQFFFISLVNITGLIGMSYYAVSFSANEQGVTIQSTPQTTAQSKPQTTTQS